MSPRDSDMKAYGFRDILFAFQTRIANATRRKPNITAKQYPSPQANKTAQLPYGKLRKGSAFFHAHFRILSPALTHTVLDGAAIANAVDRAAGSKRQRKEYGHNHDFRSYCAHSHHRRRAQLGKHRAFPV